MKRSTTTQANQQGSQKRGKPSTSGTSSSPSKPMSSPPSAKPASESRTRSSTKQVATAISTATPIESAPAPAPASAPTPSTAPPPSEIGLAFPNGCRITHGKGAIVKKPFEKMMPTLTMSSWTIKSLKQFSGQLGFIEFDTDIRLPRHIHMDLSRTKLVDERIMVIGGVGVVEVCGKIYVVAPGSLVDAVGGVPHTWSACPAGVKLPDGTVSTGKFTMVFEYEDETKFFPTQSTEVIHDVADYDEYTGDLEVIRFPKLTREEVVERAEVVWDREVRKVELE